MQLRLMKKLMERGISVMVCHTATTLCPNTSHCCLTLSQPVPLLSHPVPPCPILSQPVPSRFNPSHPIVSHLLQTRHRTLTLLH